MPRRILGPLDDQTIANVGDLAFDEAGTLHLWNGEQWIKGPVELRGEAIAGEIQNDRFRDYTPGATGNDTRRES